MALLYVSFALLVAFVIAANIRIIGFPLVLIGIVLNLTVIAANQGMPVTKRALVASVSESARGRSSRTEAPSITSRIPTTACCSSAT